MTAKAALRAATPFYIHRGIVIGTRNSAGNLGLTDPARSRSARAPISSSSTPTRGDIANTRRINLVYLRGEEVPWGGAVRQVECEGVDVMAPTPHHVMLCESRASSTHRTEVFDRKLGG